MLNFIKDNFFGVSSLIRNAKREAWAAGKKFFKIAEARMAESGEEEVDGTLYMEILMIVGYLNMFELQVRAAKRKISGFEDEEGSDGLKEAVEGIRSRLAEISEEMQQR